MIKMSITCHNCNHKFKAQLQEAFEMVKCPNCPNEQLARALGKKVQQDPRIAQPGKNRVVNPL